MRKHVGGSGEGAIEADCVDGATRDPDGYRDKRGEWRPARPAAYAPVFVRPFEPAAFLRWLRDYLFSWNLLYAGLALLTWFHVQPSLETCRTFEAGWIGRMFLRNLVLLWIVYGGWHLYLYILKRRGNRGKYSPRWQSRGGATFLFRNQVLDNIFWTCGSGCITWTAYEAVTMWMYANGRLPFIDFNTSPVAFVAVFLLVPIWREFHFYWIHRLIHWKPLYDRIHYLHHYNINPGPWSGMAMHPVEHLLYFSVTLIHWIVPSHPVHFLFNAQHTALTPASGHAGFEGQLGGRFGFGSYFHYLHHRHFDCNFGESTIPLDKWFGTFEDGARTDSEQCEARRTYRAYVVGRIVEESPEVKSFHLKPADGAPPEPYAPGQHLLLKVRAQGNGNGNGNAFLRFYTLSGDAGGEAYRISVKRQSDPAGLVSTFLHDRLVVGDLIEARGPLGDFTPDLQSRRPVVLVAGGIGITPILSMLKGCLRRHPRREIHLFLSFRDARREVFREEIEALVARHRQVRRHTFFSRAAAGDLAQRPDARAGRIDADTLLASLPRRDMHFYICGPAAMMSDVRDGLRRAGVGDDRIHTESFQPDGPQAAPDARPAERYDIGFARSGKTLPWDSEFRNLLEFAESNGIAMEAGCLFGECGACSVRVESGEVVYNHATAAQPRPGHCLPCSCRPKSPMTIDA